MLALCLACAEGIAMTRVECVGQLRRLISTERPYVRDVDALIACILGAPPRPQGPASSASTGEVRENVATSGGRIAGGSPASVPRPLSQELATRLEETHRPAGGPVGSRRITEEAQSAVRDMLPSLEPLTQGGELSDSARAQLVELRKALRSP